MAASGNQMPNLKQETLEKLNAIYGTQVSPEAFNTQTKDLNIKEDNIVWKQISESLVTRHNEAKLAQKAIEDFKNHPQLSDRLTQKLQSLQGKFIAMFAAQRIQSAVYHFYGHGNEMSQDPGNFVANALPKNAEGNLTAYGNLLKETVNVIGAAHDIVQGKGPPTYPPATNEKETAVIFKNEMQAMLQQMGEEKLSNEEKTVLQNYHDHAVKFLADEGITNATYLLFAVGKRDFDNVLSQVENIFSKEPSLSPTISAMKMSVAMSDTRRSEMYSVLAKHELLLNIASNKEEKELESLAELLKTAGVIAPTDNLKDLVEQAKTTTFPPQKPATETEEKLNSIEGFLLRLGQNYRMTTELSIGFAKDDAGRAPGLARQKLIVDVRTDNQEAEVNVEKHINAFINAIPGGFGEAAFAEDLGKIDKNEVQKQADHAHINNIVNDNTLDKNGWASHAVFLKNLHTNFSNLNDEQKQRIGQAIVECAAKPPGMKISQEKYAEMVKYENSLFQSAPSSEQLTNLKAVLTEIESVNHDLQQLNRLANSSEAELKVSADKTFITQLGEDDEELDFSIDENDVRSTIPTPERTPSLKVTRLESELLEHNINQNNNSLSNSEIHTGPSNKI